MRASGYEAEARVCSPEELSTSLRRKHIRVQSRIPTMNQSLYSKLSKRLSPARCEPHFLAAANEDSFRRWRWKTNSIAGGISSPQRHSERRQRLLKPGAAGKIVTAAWRPRFALGWANLGSLLSQSSADRGTALSWQLRFCPRVKAAGHVDDVVVACALQQATCDRAAITALAVDGERLLRLDRRQCGLEAIQRIPIGTADVACLPFAFATDVQHLKTVCSQARVEILYRDLGQRLQGKSCPLPSGGPAIEIARQIFDADSRQTKPGLVQLLGGLGDQHRIGRQAQHRPCPRSKLTGQR